MNVRFILLLLCLINLNNIVAQKSNLEPSTSNIPKSKKNMLSLNTSIQLYSNVDGMLFFVPYIPNTEIFNTIGIQYDREITKKITIGLELNYKKILINDIGLIRYAINAEAKTNFFIDKAFQGFYITPYVGVNSIQALLGEPTNFVYLGGGIGHILPINENFAFNFYYKPAFEFSLSPENKSKIWSNRFGIGVGYRF